jgi:hypothetical protein
MATSPVVPMYAPDGTLGDIPYDQMSAALRAGGKLGVNMAAPDGTHGTIPADQVQAAAKAGGKIIPYDLSKAPNTPEKKGIWDTFTDDVKSVFSSLVSGSEGPGAPTPSESYYSSIKAPLPAHVEPYYSTDTEAMRRQDAARKAAGYNLPYRAGAAAVDAVVPSQPAARMEEGAREGNSDAVIGHMLAGQALATAPLAAEGLGKVGSKVLSKASSVAAEYKPQIVSELEKTHSLTGRTVKAAAEKVLPDKPIYPGASEPAAEEFYAQSGAEQEAIRRRTVAADKATARETTSQARAQAKAGSPVPITESPNYDPGAYKAGAAERTTGAGQPSTIVPPSAGAPKVGVSEGRPATWTNERVIQLAAKGDRNAISQAVRRGFLLPENTRYVMGDMDYSSGVSNPKSVTKFSPTGEPIVQGAPMEDAAYRSRDVGEQGIPADPRSHAHATTDLEDLQRLAPGRESITGKPQEFIKVDHAKMTEGTDFVRVHRPGQADWIRYLKPVPESAISILPKE